AQRGRLVRALADREHVGPDGRFVRVSLDPADPDWGSAGSNWCGLMRPLDGVSSWIDHSALAQAIDPADPDLWYVSVSRFAFAAHGNGDGQARLLRSRPTGWADIGTWEKSPELRRMPYAVITLSGQPNRLVAGSRGGSPLATDDA